MIMKLLICFFSIAADLHDVKPFGYLCYTSIIVSSRHKFDPRARKCVFRGFNFGVKGYVLLDTVTREVMIFRNVIFFETYLPYASNGNNISNLHHFDISHETQPDPPVSNALDTQPVLSLTLIRPNPISQSPTLSHNSLQPLTN